MNMINEFARIADGNFGNMVHKVGKSTQEKVGKFYRMSSMKLQNDRQILRPVNDLLKKNLVNP